MTALSVVPQPLSHRLFFALRPPADAADAIGRLRDSLDAGGKPVGADRLHITVLALPAFDALPDGIGEELVEMAREIAAPGFPVVLDRLVSGAHSTLLCPSASLDGLRLFRERLGFTLLRAGFGLRLAKRFSPHVTLVYNNTRTFDAAVEPIGWRAQEFVLIHSMIGASRHIELGCWPLES